MRKIILVLATIGLIGCAAPTNTEEGNIPKGYRIKSPFKKEDIKYWTIDVDGHTYKVFRAPGGSYTTLHDPDCKCRHNNKSNNNETLFNW